MLIHCFQLVPCLPCGTSGRAGRCSRARLADDILSPVTHCIAILSSSSLVRSGCSNGSFSRPNLACVSAYKFIHKFFYHKEKLSLIVTSYFNENFLFHNYDTRNRDNLHLVRCNTSYGSKSVKYKGNLWNQLPNDLMLTTSLNSFKSKLNLR